MDCRETGETGHSRTGSVFGEKTDDTKLDGNATRTTHGGPPRITSAVSDEDLSTAQGEFRSKEKADVPAPSGMRMQPSHQDGSSNRSAERSLRCTYTPMDGSFLVSIRVAHAFSSESPASSQLPKHLQPSHMLESDRWLLCVHAGLASSLHLPSSVSLPLLACAPFLRRVPGLLPVEASFSPWSLDFPVHASTRTVLSLPFSPFLLHWA